MDDASNEKVKFLDVATPMAISRAICAMMGMHSECSTEGGMFACYLYSAYSLSGDSFGGGGASISCKPVKK